MAQVVIVRNLTLKERVHIVKEAVQRLRDFPWYSYTVGDGSSENPYCPHWSSRRILGFLFQKIHERRAIDV